MTSKTPCSEDLAGCLVVCLLAGDEAAVEQTLRAAFLRGLSLPLASRDLICPALDEIGEMWLRGEVSVVEEHLATSLVTRVLRRITAAIPSPPPGAPRLVLGCLAGEYHELGVKIVADVAREAGWAVEPLGANVPCDALVAFVSQRAPDALGLSVGLSAHVVPCRDVIVRLRAALPRLKILVGGLAFRRDPALRALVGADACLSDVVALRAWLERERDALPEHGAAPPAVPSTLPVELRNRVHRSARGRR